MKHNCRHEYKYLISREAAQLLRLRLPGFMKRDSHAGPGGRYTIRSLYFDDPNFDAFHDKVSGVDNRIKYRIRCYNYSDSVFRLEKKEKIGHLTRKTSQKLTPEQAFALQNCDLDMAFGPETLAGELRRGGGLKPVVLVDYDRTPFVCADGNTRITLDENLRTLPHCRRLDGPTQAMIPVMEPEQVILEVKFDGFLPGYLSDALADIPMTPMAISKFAMCLNLI